MITLVPSGVPLPDLSGVLEPLPGPSPAGPSVRYHPVIDAIREARRQDDPALPQGVWQIEVKRADWGEVIRLSLDVLLHQSKDLQVACWLVEALGYRHGFAALKPGVRMVTGLCRRFWNDGLHPNNDNGDWGARLAPLEWLDDRLAQLLCLQAVTRSGTDGEISFGYGDYLNAQRLDAVADRAATDETTAPGAGSVALAEIDASAAATPTHLLRGTYRDLARALDETAALTALLRQLGGDDAPSMVALRTRLIEIQGWIHTSLTARGADPAHGDASDDAATAPAPPTAAPRDPRRPNGPITSREDAYYWVSAAADYLLRTEPHSPTPYLLQRAIQWGGMPLHEILIEISRGRNDLAAVIDFLGFNSSDVTKNARH